MVLYYNEETGEKIIVNEDSEYDMEIAYSVDENEPSLQMLIQENPRGGADIYAYYNVWLRSRETKEPIHEERMRMKYEYIIEVQDQDEVNHDIRIGAWQRTSVEISFFYDKEYPDGKDEEDIIIWRYYKIPDNKPETIWYFYHDNIFGFIGNLSEIFNIPSDLSQISNTACKTEDGNNAYLLFENQYDSRITLKISDPYSRKQWNEQNSTDEISEESQEVLLRYFMGDKEIKRATTNLSDTYTNDMKINIIDPDSGAILESVPLTIENQVPYQQQDPDLYWDLLTSGNLLMSLYNTMTSIIKTYNPSTNGEWQVINFEFLAGVEVSVSIDINFERDEADNMPITDFSNKVKFDFGNGKEMVLEQTDRKQAFGIKPTDLVISFREKINGVLVETMAIKFDPNNETYKIKLSNGKWSDHNYNMDDYDIDNLDIETQKLLREITQEINNSYNGILKLLIQNGITLGDVKNVLDDLGIELGEDINSLDDLVKKELDKLLKALGELDEDLGDTIKDIANNIIGNLISDAIKLIFGEKKPL